MMFHYTEQFIAKSQQSLFEDEKGARGRANKCAAEFDFIINKFILFNIFYM